MLSQFSGTKDKKLLVEAEELLQDSKAKIEYLKMRILKIKQQATAGGDLADRSERSVEVTPVEERIEELRHHLRIESACLEGAKNVLKILNAAKSQDKKALQDAQQNLYESSQKLDLIRHSLELVRQDLPPGSQKSQVSHWYQGTWYQCFGSGSSWIRIHFNAYNRIRIRLNEGIALSNFSHYMEVGITHLKKLKSVKNVFMYNL